MKIRFCKRCLRQLRTKTGQVCKRCRNAAGANTATGIKDPFYRMCLQADEGKLSDAQMVELDAELAKRVEGLRRQNSLPVGEVDLS